MSPAPPAPHPTRRHAWLRVLVLLLTLLLPGAHAEAYSAPTATVAAENGGTPVEYDVLDTALRSPARGSRRPVAPARPAPLPPALPTDAEERRAPVPTGPPYALRVLRSVVLRC